jgi:hypothetical protein
LRTKIQATISSLGDHSSPVNQNRDYGLIPISLKQTKLQKTIVGLLLDRMLCDVIQKLGVDA